MARNHSQINLLTVQEDQALCGRVPSCWLHLPQSMLSQQRQQSKLRDQICKWMFFYKFHKIFNMWTVQVTFLDRNGLPDTGANINLMSDSFGNLQITSSPKIANGVHLCIKGIVTVDVNANDVKWLIDDIKKVIISRQLTKDLNLLWSHNKHSITIFSWILAFVCLCIWN